MRNAHGMFAYVTVGGLNQVQVFRTDDFSKVATIPVGKLPHGIWPSGDGTRVYVGLENADGLAAIDTLTNKVIATVPIGQAPQAVVYVPDAVPEKAKKATAAKNFNKKKKKKKTGHRNAEPAAARHRRPGRASELVPLAPRPRSRGRRAHQRHAVRSRLDPGAGGCGNRPAAETVLRTGSPPENPDGGGALQPRRPS